MPNQPSQQNAPPQMKVVVDAVEFQSASPLSETERASPTAEIQKTEFVASGPFDDDWAKIVEEVIVRGELQSKGYYRVLVEGTPYLVRAQESELHYVLRVEVESGPQYRLGDLRFANNDDTSLAFSEALLRQQLKLNRGDLFDVPKVREAIDNIRRLYLEKGYVDMVSEPETYVDEKKTKHRSCTEDRLRKILPHFRD
jgi:hypothetical protein